MFTLMTDTKHSKQTARAQTDELVGKGQRYYVPNYKPREMILDRGEGAVLFDLEGNDYVDLGSGIGVNSLGHQHPELVKALSEQAGKLWHTSNIFYTEPAIKLAELLVDKSDFAKRAFFCNSGAEANEAAIKLARKYAADAGRAPDHREIITFKGSFHGRTLATVTATAQPKYQEGFEPLPGGFVYAAAYNDEEAFDAVFSERTCAVLVEPVQGEGGVIPAKAGFLKYLRERCDEVGALLMLDQVQCGMMRTGKLFSHWHEEGVKPDTVSLAKALGCGLPIGALLVGDKAAETLQFGSHGTTFGGNPIASAVAHKALEILAHKDTGANVQARHEQLVGALEKINASLGCFAEIRGRGLMMGAELAEKWHGKAGDISEAARKSGVLVLVAGPNVCRFLPPLVISEAELSLGMHRFEAALTQYIEAGGTGEDASATAPKGGILDRAMRWIFQ
jgi:acetylornithine/N-succinyldiaminopimelate aminotransferase